MEGMYSQRHFAFCCANEVKHLMSNRKAIKKLSKLVSRKIREPNSINNKRLTNIIDNIVDHRVFLSFRETDTQMRANSALFCSADLWAWNAMVSSHCAVIENEEPYYSEEEKHIVFLSEMLLNV